MPIESKQTIIRKFWPDLLFSGIVVLLFFVLGYSSRFFDGPEGIHYIRQTDSLAFIDHYQDNGHNFFKPGTSNLDSPEGNAACEFPAIYYLLSFFYLAFGKQFFFLKLFNLILSVVGLYNLLKLCQKIIKDHIYALLIVFFFFSSTIFNYYIFNFLPDAAALSLTFIGWNLFFNQWNNKAPQWHKPMLLFMLSGLIKVTYFISPIAIILFLLLRKYQGKRTLSLKRLLIWFGGSVLVIATWNVYAILYNNHYNSEYFTTGARPIWGMPSSEVSKTWDHIYNFWLTDYFAHSSIHVLLGLLVLQFVFLKKANKLKPLILLLIAGSVCYFLLFFSQFKDHDYYALTLFPIFAFVLIGGIMTFKNLTQNKAIHIGGQLVFATIVIVGIVYSSNKLNTRYAEKEVFISEMGTTLDEHATDVKSTIQKDSKTLILKDLSKNGGLIAIDRQGWTLPSLNYCTKDTLSYFLKKGLSHVIIKQGDTLPFQQDFFSPTPKYKNEVIEIYEILE